MKTIKQEYLINAPVEKVWQAFIDPKQIDSWGAGPAKMDAKAGTKFSLWGGDVHGTNTKVVENKILEQDWFGGDWDKPSKVRFTLSKEGDPPARLDSAKRGGEASKTKVELLHENIPDDEASDIDDGWQRYYLGPLKEYVEK